MIEQEQKDIHQMKTGTLKKSEWRVKKVNKGRMAGSRSEQPTS